MNGLGSQGEQQKALKSKGDGTIVKAEDRAVGRVTFQVGFPMLAKFVMLPDTS